jgi:alpha-ribazole phosphatase
MTTGVRILLVRHPAPDIEVGRCYGRLDVGLSASGHADLGRLAGILAATDIGRVWTSPARRCRRVAEAATAFPILDHRLQELDFGRWEGMWWDEVGRAELDAWAADPAFYAPPGGETGATLIRRVQAVCRDLLAAGEDCIIVTHGGPLKVMSSLLRGNAPDLLAPAPPFGSVTSITVAHHAPQASTVSTAHSMATEQAPSTSPVNPPI